MAEIGREAATEIDTAWLAAHPLPHHGEGTDKNNRGRVLVVGGSRRVPGGLLLTGEAAYRAGAGKVQLATVESCAVGIGLAVPEAGVIGLGETQEGEIDAGSVERLIDPAASCDVLVIGPAMVDPDRAAALLDAMAKLLPQAGCVVLDAAAIGAGRDRAERLRELGPRLVFTANDGELSALLGRDLGAIEADPEGAARDAAERHGAVALLKRSDTLIAGPDGALLRYPGGGSGLATGGSGDVLAGIIAALIARGLDPLVGSAWGVWLHGEAGRRLARDCGPIGFMARDLAPKIPALMRQAS